MRIFWILLSLMATIAQAAERPNIVVLYADQFRWDCLGAMGHPDIDTPHLDALAADGVLYRNSFCTWPVCTPSRISLLTGQYVRQHGGDSNRSTLPPGVPTFASILGDAGYGTKAAGKMHITPAYQDIGFDAMELAEQNGGGRNVDDYHRYLKERGLINALDLIDQERRFRSDAPEEYWETFGAKVSDLPDEHHITTWVGDRAVESIASWEKDAPQLLMAGFLKPHHPFDPPAPWHERYDPAGLTILSGWTKAMSDRDGAHARGYFDYTTLTEPSLRRAMAYYYATITHLDHHVGRIVAALKERGVYDNTLIIFTADHGEYLGFHHLLLKGNYMYDPLVKVPLILKFPHQRFAGTVTDELVNALDVTATILQEAGAKTTADMRGAPLGVANAGRQSPREYILTEDRAAVMVRTPRYKLIRAANHFDSLFFDLATDPLEMENRYGNPNYADIVVALEREALAWFIGNTRRSAYVNESAPMIKGENVPRDVEAAEKEMLEYFEERVRPILQKQ